MSLPGSPANADSNCNEFAAASSANVVANSAKVAASSANMAAISANVESSSMGEKSGDEVYSTPKAMDEVEDTPVLSRRKQLRLQQLEEEMCLRQEFLRLKYDILCAPESDDDREVKGKAEAELLSTSGKQTVNCIEVIARNFEHPTAGPQTNSSQNAAAIYQQAENLQARTFEVHNNHSTPLSTTSHVTSTHHVQDLTTSQLAARQSVSKDLPAFSGDPTEWPIFLSAFEQSTRIAGYSNEENMIRLQKCLHGRAREAVRNCLLLPDMVPEVIRTLKMYFGRPEHILNSLIESARNFSLPKNKLELLIEYAFLIRNMCATIRVSNLTNYMNSPTLMKELLDKLSPDTKLSWALHSRAINNPNLQDFSDWLYNIAEAACQVTSPLLSSMQDKKPACKEARFNAHSHVMNESYEAAPICPACNEAHKVINCTKFAALSIAEKWDMVKNKKLCRQCLGSHQRRCWFNKPCGVDRCTIKHHPLLHKRDERHCNALNLSVADSLNNHRSTSASKLSKSFFRILPVVLYGTSKSISTYAFMDEGSSLTLIDELLANELGEVGTMEPLCIRWTGDVTRYDENSRMFDLKISSIQSKTKIYPLRGVHTIKNLNLAAESMMVDDLKNMFPHLRDIPLHSHAGVIPKLIIGADNPNLSVSLKVREGAWHEPIAIKTRLGWTLFGGNSPIRCGSLNLHKCNCSSDGELHKLIKNYFSEEIMGIDTPKTVVLSKEEQHAVSILSETCKFQKDRFVVSLLWKNEAQQLPESLPTAISRMQCLRRKMTKDPELATNLKQQINNLLMKGYATRLPNEAINQQGGKIWYLPIFIVRNPNKPNKIRLVWDAAAKTKGHALNDFLLKGPDLLVPLIRVLFNFRAKPIAICGDIAEMFHHIGVREEDTDAQRFIWWNEQENNISVFKLNVLSFGASCSPCIAHFVRDKNAIMHAAENYRAAEAITQHHYVDDFIDSTRTIAEAIALAKDVRDIHARGGFIIRNWTSNSTEVLDALSENSAGENKVFARNDSSTDCEKVLGMFWDAKADIFRYILKFVHLKRDILNQEIVPTKREVLRVLMSVFDPIGFVSCVMVYLKMLLQEIWRCNMEWDDEINMDLYAKWREWRSYLPIITNVTIPLLFIIYRTQRMHCATTYVCGRQ